MIGGIGKLGEFEDLGREDTTWFYTEDPYRFQPSSGPMAEFGSGFFMIALNPTDFVFFDGRTFDYNRERNRSSCTFCMNRKKIDVETEELVQVASVEMPYGYIDYEEVFEHWKDADRYDSKDKWDSICPECLEKVRSICCKFDESEDIVAGML